ncbi:hypothetical protein BABINDRAFT_163114 [Babjeviella inositovora NRRL Y-12698]|uniref:Gfo/Idh/MocA-like oxidoreductase N-terminal domain-containing protein n=1 Tax=Babjeviella inositovora NRRL Y-12698 TaxID=984486 RepID=A0A1E3QKE1_9ASCO|nr:uncharacterized protein BABINDRAFT_163114 [Babjeviella inositovora NRRL Y-12698]ODQ78088.1 hypothetical protein BABINDRAFT_163114 [Babjeviella inositovora NRRL Y-12698]
MSSDKVLNVGVVGTGLFATDNHLPNFQQSSQFKVVGAYNRTKGKAETFAAKAGLTDSQVYDSLDDIFSQKSIDVIDALLPVQFNLDVVKLAIKHNKPLSFEKPIAANLEQAKEIVKLSKATDLPILILEQYSYFKAVDFVKSHLPSIGKVYAFEYSSTGAFAASSKYLATSWRAVPEHIGGYLSDGGVHQLALLTGILGEVESISAHTNQIRKESGTDDILFSTVKMASGAIGTFNYGSAFGATEKKSTLKVLGDNGSILYDFTQRNTAVVKVSIGANGEVEANTQVFEFEDPNGQAAEFENFAEAVSKKDKSLVKVSPEVAFHHFAIVVAAMESSAKGGESVKIAQP